MQAGMMVCARLPGMLHRRPASAGEQWHRQMLRPREPSAGILIS